MRNIDGTTGGGQILRSALALSMATGEPVRVNDIRARRKRPGLMRQHLTAVRAAAAVSSARVTGDEVGSTKLTFHPGPIVPGAHEFRVGTAGSAGLVLQTVLPALLTAAGPSHLELHGGTHNAWAPPFDFLERTFLPVIGRLGPTCSARLSRHGFYPTGGGHFSVDVEPCDRLGPLELLIRGAVSSTTARVLCAALPGAVGQRESRALEKATGWPAESIDTVTLPHEEGPGNAIVADVVGEHVTSVFSSFGARKRRSESVADDVASQVARYMATDAPVDVHLADQLLLPLAIGGGGTYRTLWPVDEHVTSHAALLRGWLGVDIAVEPESEAVARVTVTGADLSPRRSSR